ncbi:hypothetical protein [Haloferax sp. CBA1150]|uniref:hypothetical protein n=1 Tax=Haloferax sp. CBA1150 TaxID=2650754 RepID=UPI001CD964D9|nr:hypothetical protein [Haloferax sp. CBA1150]
MFPIPVFLSVVAVSAVAGIMPAIESGSGEAVLSFFAVLFLIDGINLLVGLFVVVFLALDVFTVRESFASWQPTWFWVGAGFVHIAGTLFALFYVVSVPLLSYYLYRRGKRVGSPSL